VQVDEEFERLVVGLRLPGGDQDIHLGHNLGSLPMRLSRCFSLAIAT
jgi:hypothetical protein